MTYPISKFVEAAEALREEYENAEVTSSDTSITVSRNLLVDYFEIIDTYIEGLQARTGLNFRSRVSILNTSVTIERVLTKLPNVALPSFTFHFDNDILSRTDVYAFSVLLDSIKRLLTKTILQFDDQFYEDRYNGVPFVDDRKFEFNLQDGEGYKLIRVDEIDWKALFKVQ